MFIYQKSNSKMNDIDICYSTRFILNNQPLNLKQDVYYKIKEKQQF